MAHDSELKISTTISPRKISTYVTLGMKDTLKPRLTRRQELFRRIGPITKLQLRYDRSGRSEGVAFVTYESKDDAAEAVRQFDGANANGTSL